MKTNRPRLLFLATSFFASAGLAQAHPGHDGDGLTWNFGHLAAHPLATLGCALVLVTGAWAVARLLSVGNERLVAVVRRREAGRRN